jgi:hypothetical protein
MNGMAGMAKHFVGLIVCHLTKEPFAKARKFISCFGITFLREDQFSPPPLLNAMPKHKI